MTGVYQPWLVSLSVAIAVVAAYIAFVMSSRVRRTEGVLRVIWLASGAVCMGSGIWTMHFVGMVSFELPIPMGYDAGITLLSWFVAVLVSALALWITSRRHVPVAAVVGGALTMGAGICAMHYLGMWAMRMRPAITYDPVWFTASVLIAVGASGAAILIIRGLRGTRRQRTLLRWMAAVVMGAAISAMHYTAMAGAQFAPGSVCLAANRVDHTLLSVMFALIALALLAVAFVAALFDVRLQTRTQALIASLSEANSELTHLSSHDALTGLPNRRTLNEQMVRNFAAAGEAGSSVAVVLVDLDGFKPVNDALGFVIGDEVLREIARRLAGVARDGDFSARVGGDEFALLWPGAVSESLLQERAQQVLDVLRAPLPIGEHSIHLSASVGIALFPRDGDGARPLICADSAMNAAKRGGKNQYRVFEPSMDLASEGLVKLQSEMRVALRRGELRLHLQPKWDPKLEAFRGAEALVRWQHPTRGLLAPGAFIAAAEQFGLIADIGQWVLDEACQWVNSFVRAGLDFQIAVNLSPQQFRQRDLVERVRRTLEKHNVPRGSIKLEITESSAMENPEALHPVLDAFHRLGVELSIDDFGTGYSSLAYLRTLRVHELKIDRAFVRDMEDSPEARVIVDTIVRLAHGLHLAVVAEGVETEGQSRLLASYGVDLMQGWLYSRPVDAADLLARLAGPVASREVQSA
jgi:diguanylate cyclase (GGDEF)-like protein